MKTSLFFVSVLFATAILIGCLRSNTKNITTNQIIGQSVVAVYTDNPVIVDGKLDEIVWKTASVYAMSLPKDNIESGMHLQEGGCVQFAWDDKYFYVAMDFTDSDIVADGKTDQLHHYQMGDVGEFFLKPEDYTWYWELYVTPAGKKTSFWFPGRGRLFIPSVMEYTCGLKVAAQCDGTLNNWQDRDNGWTAEMAMPIRDLTARGESFGPGSIWHILIGRYNYSRYLNSIGPELSSSPQLSTTNYHLIEEYAEIVFEK